MKARIYKFDDTDNITYKYSIIVEGETLEEKLAIDAISRQVRDNLAEIRIDVMGLGIFEPLRVR